MKDLAVTALVLAAGRSSRMGSANKLLMPVRGRALITHILETLKSSGLGKPVVVCGYQQREMEALLSPYCTQIVRNPDYLEGLSSSLKQGIRALPEGCDGVLICLGDMPFVSAETLRDLVKAFDPQRGRSICIPTSANQHGNQRGNPVLIAKKFFPELLELTGDHGAKDLIRAKESETLEVPVQDDGIFLDLDTQEAFDLQ